MYILINICECCLTYRRTSLLPCSLAFEAHSCHKPWVGGNAMVVNRQFTIDEFTDEDGVIHIKKPMKFQVDVSWPSLFSIWMSQCGCFFCLPRVLT